MPEIFSLATILVTSGLILLAAVLLGWVTSRVGLPVFLLFLAIGMLAAPRAPAASSSTTST